MGRKVLACEQINEMKKAMVWSEVPSITILAPKEELSRLGSAPLAFMRFWVLTKAVNVYTKYWIGVAIIPETSHLATALIATTCMIYHCFQPHFLS